MTNSWLSFFHPGVCHFIKPKINSTKDSRVIFNGLKATEHFTGDTWVKMLTVDGENFDSN